MNGCSARRLVVVLMMGLLLAMQGVTVAREAFVSDALQLDLRAGPGNQYRILQMMPAGQPLRVAEESEGWSRVVLPSGREGWMLTRFLADQPSATARLQAIESRERALVEENADLSERLADATARLEQLEGEFLAGAERRDLLEQRVAEARQGLGMFEDNQILSKQLVDAQRALDDLGHEIERLERRHEQRWFLAGGAVLGAGLLLGALMARLVGRRRPRWSNEL